MEKEYKVTIGMPVYGVEKYIRKCILSVLNQSFEGETEILVVDDLGPDRSMDIVRELQASHPKGSTIRILTQPQNMGCWAARNRILDEAQGKYLLLVDSDDYLAEDAVEKMYEAAEKYEAEAVYGSVESVDEEGRSSNFSQGDMKLPFKTLLGKDLLASYANQNLHATLYNFIWNVLLRTDFIKQHHLRFHETRFADDILFETDMQPLIERAVLLPDETYFYVLRPGSLSNFQLRKEIKLAEIEQYIKIYSYIKNQVKELKDKPYYETRCAKVMIYMFYIICGALKNRDKITPRLTDKAIRDAMRHPIGLCEILKFKTNRMANLGFWLIGALPPACSVAALKFVAKKKKLI
ncbi:glycosyltransferase family 2 protein [Prevotella sp. E13-17]|uniref:glycosyltransferase family 2 protein n=1 Tax=Prevotella sp. E13-17 TaxID=2913616 RepID=UPI001EDACEB6|nr:glycosyltransferase family 2 protein [Prevotella sp. E13-17]UKK51890.1 glycosyltransferase family 2 protein [Prevotella sp. E13-17]